jgi:hypothetical protein
MFDVLSSEGLTLLWANDGVFLTSYNSYESFYMYQAESIFLNNETSKQALSFFRQIDDAAISLDNVLHTTTKTTHFSQT